MTTSMYSNFITHNLDTILARADRANRDGDGTGWGDTGHTLHEAAAAMKATVVGQINGDLLCELSDRLYLLGDSHGPWALEVATKADLD